MGKIILEYNPYHDEKGLFAEAENAMMHVPMGKAGQGKRINKDLSNKWNVNNISPYSKKNIEDKLEKIFGDRNSLHKALEVSGIPEGATVTLENYSDTLRIHCRNKDLTMIRTIGIDDDGKKFIHNDMFFLEEDLQKSGKGLEIFSNQVKNASKNGFSYIETHAARSSKMNGYYTWPRFGYDQKLSNSSKYEWPDKFKSVNNVSDLMKSQEGRDFWKEKGYDLYSAKFDLSKSSQSQRVLNAYIKAKKEKVKQ